MRPRHGSCRYPGLAHFLPLAILAVALPGSGCIQRTQQPEPTFTEATAYLETILKGEKINAKIIPLKNTLWIYLPLEDDLFLLKAKVRQPIDPIARRQEKFALQYIDVTFQDGWFIIEYDIMDQRVYPQELGYTNTYSEVFQSLQRRLFQALYRAYGGLKAAPVEQSWRLGRAKAPPSPSQPDDTPAKQKASKSDGTQRLRTKGLTITIRSVSQDDWFNEFQGREQKSDGKHERRKAVSSASAEKRAGNTSALPDFIVIVATDIRTGIETRMILQAADFKRTMTDPGFQEEYRRRIINEMPQGYLNAIGDREGAHLDIHELTWPEFLSKQIKHRIRYKYQVSAFPPGGDHARTIRQIVAQAVRTYGYQDFSGVVLHDLASGVRASIPKTQLLAPEDSDPR